jgi:hypothetical protein
MVSAAAVVAMPTVAARRGQVQCDCSQDGGDAYAGYRGFHIGVLLRFLHGLRFPSCGFAAKKRIACNAAIPRRTRDIAWSNSLPGRRSQQVW